MLHFDWSISLGNIITCFTGIVLIIIGWKDLTWRITNLESWRREHMIDACARDEIIVKLDRIIERMEQREKDRDQWNRERKARRGE